MRSYPIHQTRMQAATIRIQQWLVPVLCLVGCSVFGQSPNDFEKKFSSTVCDCYQQKNINKDLNKDNIEACLIEAMEKHEDDIVKECLRLYNDTTEETGYKFGTQLVENIMSSMIATCDYYYHVVDSARHFSYQTDRPDTIRTRLMDMEQTPESNRNAEYYSDKALLYFIIGDRLQCSQQVKLGQEKDPNHGGLLFLQAWLEELNQHYDQAILLYEKLIDLTSVKHYRIFVEVAKRKKLQN